MIQSQTLQGRKRTTRSKALQNQKLTTRRKRQRSQRSTNRSDMLPGQNCTNNGKTLRSQGFTIRSKTLQNRKCMIRSSIFRNPKRIDRNTGNTENRAREKTFIARLFTGPTKTCTYGAAPLNPRRTTGGITGRPIDGVATEGITTAYTIPMYYLRC